MLSYLDANCNGLTNFSDFFQCKILLKHMKGFFFCFRAYWLTVGEILVGALVVCKRTYTIFKLQFFHDLLRDFGLCLCTTRHDFEMVVYNRSQNTTHLWKWAGSSGIESQWERDFPPVQTGPGAHPASCKMGTKSFPGVKCGRGRADDYSPPSSTMVME